MVKTFIYSIEIEKKTEFIINVNELKKRKHIYKNGVRKQCIPT